MEIKNKVVAGFHYTISNEQGEELESSAGGEPSLYLHGAGNIIKGLESELAGHSTGDTVHVTLQPAQAFGIRDEGRIQKVPVKHLLHQGKLRAGMTAQLNTEKGRKPVTVTKVGKFSATVDTNHPYAGMAITFNVEIISVREATASELSHGHAHGEGGHQH